MNISSVISSISTNKLVDEAVMSLLTFAGGYLVAKTLDDAKYFKGDGRISYNGNIGAIAMVIAGSAIACVGAIASLNRDPSNMNLALKISLLVAPSIFSTLKRTQVLYATSVENTKLPIAINGLRDKNGALIRLIPGESLVKVNLAKNGFGISEGYIPERLLTDLHPSLPLRLMYSGYPIEVLPKTFKCTHIRSCAGNDWNSAGLLRNRDGSKIEARPNEQIVELTFGDNPIFKKGYLPKRFLRDLATANPLELKYRNKVVLITKAWNCVDETAPKPVAVKKVGPKPLVCEPLFPKVKAKRAEVHYTPEVIIAKGSNATVVKAKKPSVPPATKALIENNGASRITEAALAVAESVEALSQSLPNEEFEKELRNILNGPGSTEEKDAKVALLMKKRIMC